MPYKYEDEPARPRRDEALLNARGDVNNERVADQDEAATDQEVAASSDSLFSRRDRMLAPPLFARGWIAVAGLCALAAAALWWFGRIDGAFVLATLGVVVWFLDERNRLRRTRIETPVEDQTESEKLEKTDEW